VSLLDSHENDAVRELNALLASIGLIGAPQRVYVELLVRGPASFQSLLKRTRAAPEDVEGALQLLQRLFLVQRQVFRDNQRFYASHPRIAWRWQELEMVWSEGLTLSSVEFSPALLDVADEKRRRLMPKLRDASMRVFHPGFHTSVTIPRGRAYPDDDEYAYACAEAIILAERRIVALQKPPFLPHLALFWSAILDRRKAGIPYTRCATLEEVQRHGCAIVSRDMDELGIDLVVQPSSRIWRSLYLIDDRILLVRDDSGARFLVHREEVVSRCRTRLASVLADATPARTVVADLRRWAVEQAQAVRSQLGAGAEELFLNISEGGRFADIGPLNEHNLQLLSSGGFIKREEPRGYSIIAPTEGVLASLR
jgi:hypothetical protein